MILCVPIDGPMGFDANADKVESLEARLVSLRGGEATDLLADLATVMDEVSAAQYLARTYKHDEGALVPQLLEALRAKPKETSGQSVVVGFMECLACQGPSIQVAACTEDVAVL